MTEDWGRSISDLRRAQELSPNDVTFNRILCWQLAVTGDPDGALPYCERAIAHDPSGQAREGRGLAYALMGRLEKAIADFEAFLANGLIRRRRIAAGAHYGPSRMDWIEKLRSGDSPFDSETLRDLRVRPVSPGGAPC